MHSARSNTHTKLPQYAVDFEIEYSRSAAPATATSSSSSAAAAVNPSQLSPPTSREPSVAQQFVEIGTCVNNAMERMLDEEQRKQTVDERNIARTAR